MHTALDNHSSSDDHRGFVPGTLLYRLGHYNAFLMNGLIPCPHGRSGSTCTRSEIKCYLNPLSSSSASGNKSTEATYSEGWPLRRRCPPNATCSIESPG